MSKRKLSDSDLDSLIKGYRKGERLKDLCEEFGVSYSCAQKSIHRRGVNRRIIVAERGCQDCGTHDLPKNKNNNHGYHICNKCYNIRHKKLRLRLRKEIIDALGGKCECCGETSFYFLTVDHINGGGNKERRMIGNGNYPFYLKREGYPKDKYRCLCMNCNHVFGIYGYCPVHSTVVVPVNPDQSFFELQSSFHNIG